MEEEDKISALDGRRIRWLLIYGILQTLISVTRIPREVSDTEGVSYSLCCQIAGTPPWKTIDGATSSPLSVIITENAARTQLGSSSLSASPSSSIESTAASISSTAQSASRSRPVHLKNSSSEKSLVSLHTPTSPRPNFSEIVVPGYGNGRTAEARRHVKTEDSTHSATSSDAISTPELASPESSSDDGDTSPDLEATHSYERDNIHPKALKITKQDFGRGDLDAGLDELGRMHAELEGYVLS